MNPSTFILVSLVVVGFGLVSRRLDSTPVTPPMVFVAIGLLLSTDVMGGIGILVDESHVHTLAEITLTLILFADATRIDLRALRREMGLPVRMLGIGMPLTIVLGGVLAKLIFPSFEWLEAMVLGAVLAPTDAALGQAVMSSAAVPLRIRQALNVESGLNDGVALPVVMVLAALASIGGDHSKSSTEWAMYAVLQVTLGPLTGIGVGWGGGKLISNFDSRGWIKPSFGRLSGLALAILAFAVAQQIGGNGFIAAFVAGATLGNLHRKLCGPLYEFLEAEGQLLMLIVFLLLGAVLAPSALAELSARTVAYAVLSLTVIRMAPVTISLIGTGLRAPSVAFLGWFGPRGLASILFGILVVQDAHLAHGRALFTITVSVVVLSVFAHGLSAVPAAAGYGRLAGNKATAPAEHESVTEHPLRVRQRKDS